MCTPSGALIEKRTSAVTFPISGKSAKWAYGTGISQDYVGRIHIFPVGYFFYIPCRTVRFDVAFEYLTGTKNIRFSPPGSVTHLNLFNKIYRFAFTCSPLRSGEFTFQSQFNFVPGMNRYVCVVRQEKCGLVNQVRRILPTQHSRYHGCVFSG